MPGGESGGTVLSVFWEWGLWGSVEVLGVLGGAWPTRWPCARGVVVCISKTVMASVEFVGSSVFGRVHFVPAL